VPNVQWTNNPIFALVQVQPLLSISQSFDGEPGQAAGRNSQRDLYLGFAIQPVLARVIAFDADACLLLFAKAG